MEGKISSSGCTGERVVRRVEAPGVTPVFLTCIAGCFWYCLLKIINTRLKLDPSGVWMCWQMHIAVLVPTVGFEVIHSIQTGPVAYGSPDSHNLIFFFIFISLLIS